MMEESGIYLGREEQWVRCHDECVQTTPERHIGPFRWRGHLNFKDIVERSLSVFVGAGFFYLLVRLVG